MNKKILGVLVVLSVILFFQGDSQLLGIDFGTQFWKAAIISPGKNLIIVENSRSQRKTLNSVAFDEGVRFFELESRVKRLKKPQASHFYLNRLIRSLDDAQPLTDYKFQSNTYTIPFESDQTMNLEQAVGNILRNLKSLASIQAGTQIKDCVITVPANWGPKARTSLINAANLADLSVLGLINQNSAAMINFAITRNDTDPINMVVFNYGSSNLQISVMKLWGQFNQQKNKTIQSLKALSHVVVNDVGGLTIDKNIANYLSEQFKKIHKIDPRTKQRSFNKLLHKSSDAKEVLSANKQTKVYVQGLIDGIDMQVSLKRDFIDQLQMFNSFQKYIQQAITKAGLKKQDISFVQLIGGTSRVPRVSNIVKQFFENAEVGAHMNGDEAMAFGCALRAANLSIALRVKQLNFYDILDYETRVVISSQQKGVIAEELLFTKDDQHGAKKTITISTNDEDLKIVIYKGEEQILKEYVTEGLTDWKQKYNKQNITEQPKVLLNFVQSTVSIVDLKDVYVAISINVTETKQTVDYVEEQIQLNVTETDQNVTDKANNQQQQKDNIQQVVNKTIKSMKPIKKNISLVSTVQKKHICKIQQIFSKYQRYRKDDLKELQKVILKFQETQRKIKQRAKVRNDFESSLYRIKDGFGDPVLDHFRTPNQVQNLKKVVAQQITWLDQNAYNAQKEEFQNHFNILYNAYKDIYNRTLQYQNRQKTYNETMNFLSLTYIKTMQLNSSHSWLSDRIQKQLIKINQTAQWINNKLKEQSQRPLNQNPIIYNHNIIQKAEDLREEYYLLKMIPRPKITKPKPEEKKENVQNAQETIDLDEQNQKQQTNQQNEQNVSNQEQTQQQHQNGQEQQNQQNQEQKKDDL